MPNATLDTPALDPRVVRTRRLLTDALYSLVGEHPYPSISVKAIADAAGVNRATFYAHFVDKDDAVRHAYREGIDQAIANGLEGASGEDRLGALVRAAFAFVETFVGKCRHDGRGALPPKPQVEIDARVADVVRAWVAERRAGSAAGHAVSEHVAAVAVASAINGAAWDWIRQRDRLPLDTAAQEALVVVAGAFEAAVGRA